jgi:glycerophosphoryl diester phosphodiesterase
LFALRRAVAAGADALELDVHATVDGVLVVCHDATVDATTDGAGAIAGMTLAEVQALDNGYRFEVDGRFPFRGRAPQDPALRVATLAEVLEAFPGVFLNLDIKQTAPEVEPYEAALAGLLRAYGRTEDVIVASFLDRATDAFAVAGPEFVTSAGTDATAAFYFAVQGGTESPPMTHVAFQVPARFGEIDVVTPAFVHRAHEAGVAVHVWTIDDEVEMERLIGLGVDGIITDHPTRLTSVLDRLGAGWRRT